MKELQKFKGVFVAFYTAYDEKGEISIERTKKLVNYMYDKGIRGLYTTGSSGESPYLTIEERMIIMKAIKEAAGDRMVLIAHVGASNTRDSIKLAKYASELGYDAISSIPPTYYKLGENAIAEYWESMIDVSHLPFIIYNMPSATGVNISTSLFKRMLTNEYCIGIKNTSLPVMDIQQYKQVGGDECVVFNGPDEQFAAGRIMGADSGIGGTYGIMPELFLKINSFVINGELANASKLQQEVTSIIIEMLSYGNLFAVCKEILKLRGMDIGLPRRPIPPLEKSQINNVSNIEKRINNTISKWC